MAPGTSDTIFRRLWLTTTPTVISGRCHAHIKAAHSPLLCSAPKPLQLFTTRGWPSTSVPTPTVVCCGCPLPQGRCFCSTAAEWCWWTAAQPVGLEDELSPGLSQDRGKDYPLLDGPKVIVAAGTSELLETAAGILHGIMMVDQTGITHRARFPSLVGSDLRRDVFSSSVTMERGIVIIPEEGIPHVRKDGAGMPLEQREEDLLGLFHSSVIMLIPTANRFARNRRRNCLGSPEHHPLGLPKGTND